MASPLLLSIILCSYYSIAHGGDEDSFVVVPTFEPEAVCSTTRVKLELGRGTVSMPLVHRHGPCAPSSQSSDKPSFADTPRRNRARANYILSRASEGMVTTTIEDGNVSIPTHLGGFVDSLEYVVTVGIGTPAVQQTVLIDTGSDLSWVQCAPCNSTECYPQKDPLFDPSNSSTYTPVPCNSDECSKLVGDHYANGCTNGSLCGYGIKYGDGSRTRGVLSHETLTLAPGVTVKDFEFGCGHDQDSPFDKYDGLLGLGGRPESLVLQTSSVYGGAFSYCLPAQNSAAGFLTLGAPSNNTAGFVFTPLRRLLGTFYAVTLAGISVAGKQLDIPPAVFANDMVIDSGTVITELPGTAYSALRTAFRSAMSAYPLLPPNDDGLDTCYNFTGFSNVTVPKVALTFSGGATIDLDMPSGVLVEGCLAFAGWDSDKYNGILGNVNQRTFEVLYNSGQGHVGFRAVAC